MASRSRAEGWKISEDEDLCRARLIFGNDAETGINQRDSTLWSQTHAYYDANRPVGSVFRDKNGCENRFKKISKECMTYGAALRAADLAHSSGQNYTDTMLLAESNYSKIAKKPWKLQHCWAILKDEPKYQNPPIGESAISLDGENTPGSEGGASSSRPIGQKATKAARRKKDLPSERDKQLEELISWTKAQDIRDKEREANRAREFAIAEAAEQRAADECTMQVDPNIFTPHKKTYWERKQKNIMDHEMSEEFYTPPLERSSKAARNLFTETSSTQWEDDEFTDD